MSPACRAAHFLIKARLSGPVLAGSLTAAQGIHEVHCVLRTWRGVFSRRCERPHGLTLRFVGSPLLPAFRGGICGRALRLVVLFPVFVSSNPDRFGLLINANFLKSAPDCNAALMHWTNHLFLCFLLRLIAK